MKKDYFVEEAVECISSALKSRRKKETKNDDDEGKFTRNVS